ncbi:MAG: AarF/ABC1/UbiB kinase family protein [Phycisphaerae bacterium]
MTPLQLTRSVRSLNRLRHIAQVLTRHGFGHIVAQINLTRFVPVWMLRKKAPAPVLEEGASAIGRRLTQVCAELGPTFIKLGQMMSTRPDIVPAEVLKELRILQDEVPPFDTSIAKNIIAQELRRPLEECFASISDKPIASASIGQVYRARAKDGTELVVKVRRPDIDQIIQLDMQLLRWLAESLENLMPELRIYRPTMLVEELDQMLTRELDYINEASTTARFAAAFEDDPGIRIPDVYWDFTSTRVLTLEALRGVNVNALLAAPDAADKRTNGRLVARRLADSYLKQIFELGVFHADPHPGNILVEPPAKVGLIDFGQVGTMTDELMTQLIVMVYASVHKEIDVVIDTLADLGVLGPETNRRNLHHALQVLLDKYYGLPLKRLDLTTLTNEFADVVRRHDVVIPRDILMLSKALGTVASVTVRLDPDLDLLELLKPRIKQALSERLSPAHVARGTMVWGWHLFSLARQAPVQLRAFLRGLTSGTWKLRVRHENLERLINELDRSSNRLAFSIVIAAIIVGSSVVVSAATDMALFGLKVQYLGIIGYLIAGVLGLGLTWAIFRSGRLH